MKVHDRSHGMVLVVGSAAVNVAGAALVSVLQVWSASAALPREYVGRPILAVLLVLPMLLGRAWGRWPALAMGAATAFWLGGSAATAPLLPPEGQVAVALAAVVVLVAIVLPWHPAARAVFNHPSGPPV